LNFKKRNINMPLSIGEGGSLSWQRLARVNEHPRDLRIQFNEEEHSYAIDGSKIGWVSCTQFKGQFFGHFDPDAVIKKMMSGSNWIKSPYYGRTAEDIKAGWAASGDEASTAGTRMHLDIEHYYNSSELSVESMKRDDDWTPNPSVEWDQFMSYQAKVGSKMEPYRTEWLVWNEDIKLAGSIDMLYKKSNGKYAIYDWKRSKEIKTENRYQSGYGPLSHLPDANYWTYSMQLNIYRMILKQKYDMDVDEMALVILHPNQANWRVIKINIMEEEVLGMFACRRAALAVPGNDGSNPVVVLDSHEEHDTTAAPTGWIGLD
jgi:hypothetical protein